MSITLPPHGTFKKIQFGDNLTAHQVDVNTVRVDAGGGDGIKFDQENVGHFLHVDTNLDVPAEQFTDSGIFSSSSYVTLDLFGSANPFGPDWQSSAWPVHGDMICVATDTAEYQWNVIGDISRNVTSGSPYIVVDLRIVNAAGTVLCSFSFDTGNTLYVHQSTQIDETFIHTFAPGELLRVQGRVTSGTGTAQLNAAFQVIRTANLPDYTGFDQAGISIEDHTGGGIDIRVGGDDYNSGYLSLESTTKDGIYINSNGNGPIGIENSGGPGGIRIKNDSDGPLALRQTGGVQWPSGVNAAGNGSVGDGIGFLLENDGSGAFIVNNFGDGPFRITSTGDPDENGGSLMLLNNGGGELRLEHHGDGPLHLIANPYLPDPSDDAILLETGAGNITLAPSSGRTVRLLHLPTSDPGISGGLWNSSGTLKVSP